MAANGHEDFPPPATNTPASDADFKRFISLADSDEGWEEKYSTPESGVWTRQEKGSSINMLKARIDYSDVSASVLYDVLHDPYYRRTWDDNMIDGFEICHIDAENDIGYYSLRFPTPMGNRDYVNQRSWRVYEELNQYIIFNHSVVHPKLPPRPSFTRALSFLSGYVIRAQGEGCRFFYVSHNDPKGMIPTFVINKIMTRIVPKLGTKIRAACLAYPAWKEAHEPSFKPWLSKTVNNQLPSFEDSLSRDLVDARGKLLVQSTAELGMDVPKAAVAAAAGGEDDDEEEKCPENSGESDL